MMKPKFLRLPIAILSFVCIFLNIKTKEPLFLYATGVLWMVIGVLNYSMEKAKRLRAVYITFNKTKTSINYILLSGLLLSNYFLFTDRHIPGRGATTIFVSLSLIATTLLSRFGDHYYLFDEEGIKTRGESLPYSKITDHRITDSRMEFDTEENRNEMVVSKKLLTPEIVTFLSGKLAR